jgi:putative ABC transport system ATP-binding protein
MLITKNATKTYAQGNGDVHAIVDVSISIPAGASCAIVGPSGSGKSTFLGLCAGLDSTSSGEIEVCGQNLSKMSENELADFRGEHIGFIFQSFELIPALTALENVMLPAELQRKNDARQRSHELLGYMGLAHRVHHYPSQLSGGEQQRVAIARAFVNEPKILFGDEPTGNLDRVSGELVIKLLFQLNQEFKTTLILATHNQELAKLNDYLVTLSSGQLVSIVHQGKGVS